MTVLHAFHAREDYFSPSQLLWLLAHNNLIRLVADDHPGFTLHTITGFQRPELNHYYGFICHLTPTQVLNHFLYLCFQQKKNYWSRCQASSVTAPVPVRNATLKHVIGLTEYRASRYFARLPTNTAVSGSLSLCTSNFLWLPSDPTVSQWRPCQSDYLPLSRGDSALFQTDGFAGFAEQTKKAAVKCGF